jgi:16S rRNA (adenine1518-N6/adenine1519-N6)-dimethyltransferase
MLARKARRLIAVELDRVLSAQLRMKFNMQPNVEIIEGDILKIELDTVFGAKPGSLRTGLNFAPEPARVIGNLPYYITSDILLRLLEYHRYFSTIVIMVQKEVADRLAASAGSRDYGLLSATAQLYGRVEQLFTLPPSAFAPPPKVHSSVVRITIKPRLESLRVSEAEFIAFLKLCFGQKRKTLWNNLKTRYDEDALRAAMAKSGVKPAIRAEALPLEKNRRFVPRAERRQFINCFRKGSGFGDFASAGPPAISCAFAGFRGQGVRATRLREEATR